MIDTVLVREGERIETGAALFVWDTDDVRLRLLDAAERLSDVRRAEEALDTFASPAEPQGRNLETLGSEVKALEHRLAEGAVTAGAQGLVRGLSLRPGQLLAEGQRVMRLEDRDRLLMVATLTPRQAESFRVGEPITLRVGGLSVPATVEKLTRYQLTAEVPNPGGQLALGAAQVELARDSVSLFGLFWR